MKPRRIQRQRSRGWRMPAGVVYVGRPSKWGNPFRLEDWRGAFQSIQLGERADAKGRRAAAVKVYRMWLTNRHRKVDRTKAEKEHPWAVALAHKIEADRPKKSAIRRELGGRDLACWCPLDQPCHADVLLEIANG